MKLTGPMIETMLLPKLNTLLPQALYINRIRTLDGQALVDAQVRVRGEWFPVVYTVRIEAFRFDTTGRYLTISYEESMERTRGTLMQKLLTETERILAKNFMGRTLLSNVLPDSPYVLVSDNRLTIQLGKLVELNQELQEVHIQGLAFTTEGIELDVDVSVDMSTFNWDVLAKNDSIPTGEDKAERVAEDVGKIKQELMVLEQEESRFYDRLRSKIEGYMREKMGTGTSDKLTPYLLLAPDLFVLLARLAKDDRVPLRSKSIALLAAVYFMSPLDIIPEVLLGPVGFADDIVLAVMALNKILVEVDEKIIEEHWNGDKSIIGVIRDVLAKADSLVGTKRLQMLKTILKRGKGKA
ncbi:YkvA family protein [Aneurinibacillus uraniidurans]|uniref:YkvA family protein n=1 Tax=Aneurinibacillus uraniidurans TaxID=2966586 RepID=UPI00234AEBDC|nr:YkvA family protein [Aneurinibacillus sp. B1]WCN36966.1 YkvA family protein [Aneurinibacillus sp. B1]